MDQIHPIIPSPAMARWWMAILAGVVASAAAMAVLSVPLDWAYRALYSRHAPLGAWWGVRWAITGAVCGFVGAICGELAVGNADLKRFHRHLFWAILIAWLVGVALLGLSTRVTLARGVTAFAGFLGLLLGLGVVLRTRP
ncbi:MAG TPA: hypothetical protein VHD15_01370 [Hyphomicrobiales bacterium]|nr:hypothetical protein [Hyphomicrobiales bacterium]